MEKTAVSNMAKFIFLISLLLSLHAVGPWEKVAVPTTASLRGLSVVSAATVWASGTEGTVMRTEDGGKHWTVITVPGAEKLDFRGIQAFDGATALVISSGPAENGQAQIYRTSDGGASWKKVFEEKRKGAFFDAIRFWDRKHGMVLSDPVDGRFVLFSTDDGGATWKQIPPLALPPALPNEGAFAASNSCLTVQGENNAWFATGAAGVARIFRSNDRGRSWSAAETPMHPPNASSGIFSLVFPDAKHGLAVGGDYMHPESSELPNVMRSLDGGRTWQADPPTNPAGMYLSGVVRAGTNELVAVGIKGMLVKSGDSWHKEADDNLNAVAVLGGIEWAVGAKGLVLRMHRP
jgi:photosystem II stability/assembly factor-like uncharacterized protein